MNQSLYQSNLDFLFSNRRINGASDHLLDFLKQPDENWKNNLAQIAQNGFEKNSIRFHSARDPKREAKRQIENLVEKNNPEKRKCHLVFLGAGLGYPLAEALNDPVLESFLVIETDPEILYYCLALTKIHDTRKDIYFYFCPAPETDILENILPFFQNKNLDKIGVFHHRPSFQIPSSRFPELEKQLGAIMYKRAINQATIIKFQGIWNKNIALNIKALLNATVGANTLNDLVNLLRGKIRNVVLCGAGPSLAESYADLKKYRNRYFLICADTAFIPLVKNNITPDIVISADPQWLNHFFAMSPAAAHSTWLMDPVVCYQSTHYLDRINAPMYWWDNPFYLDQVIRDFKSRGEIAHGGSVSTNAFDLALKLDPETLILAGQDLSFSNKTAHVKGAALESMVFFKNNRFHGFEMHNLRQMKSLPPRMVNNRINKNETVFTNDKMKVFIDWFENQTVTNKFNAKVKFYNATTRGVLLNGFTHSTFSDILSNSPDEKFSMRLIRGKNRQDQQQNSCVDNAEYVKCKNKFARLQTQCACLEDLYRKNMSLAQKIQSSSISPGHANEINRELNKNDALIKKYAEVNKIISINAQSAILKITELGDAGANSGFLLYKALYLSARKLNYFFEKISIILS